MKITEFTKFFPAALTLAVLMPTLSAQAQPTVPASPAVPAVNQNTPPEAAYDRYMRLGYAAAQRGDHRAAATYFRSALYERPNDRYATIAYWNARDALNKQNPNNASQRVETDYERYMRIGYDATEKGDYQTALINFQRALNERPGDYYATQAARNVATYINQGAGAAQR
ncbi:MAG: hypothetical protein ACM37W_06795 [Actinomycetota bacterium]